MIFSASTANRGAALKCTGDGLARPRPRGSCLAHRHDQEWHSAERDSVPEAVSVLRARKQTSSASAFVFPGDGKTGHLVEPKKAWAAILRRASMRRLLDRMEELGKLTAEERQQANAEVIVAAAAAEERYRGIADTLNIDPALYDMTDLRIHDLRRTLGSWQAKTGASLSIIGKSLNHKTHQATAIYARLDLDPVRQSVNTATQAMLAAAGMKQAASVGEATESQRWEALNHHSGNEE